MRFATATQRFTCHSRSQRGRRIAGATMATMLAIGIATDVHADPINPGGWVSVPAPADPSLQNLNVAADAPTRGMWSTVQSWPLNGLHTALLPNGRVLTFGTTLDGGAQNGRYFDVWDPTLGFGANSHTTTYDPNRQDSFCAAATYLTDGRLLISGGNGSTTSTFYNPSNNTTATATARMADERWYATMLTLPDGRPLILGGMVPYAEGMQGNPDLSVAQGLASMTPEVFESGSWRSLFGANSRDAFGPDFLRASYPRAWVTPTGQVFGISAERMWYLDPSGNGSIRTAGVFKGPPSSTTPVNVGATNSAVMFAPGRILQVGGNGGFNGDGLPASRMATVVDFNGATPVLTEQPPMTFARRYPNAIVLADGRVVVTGGTLRGNDNGPSAVFAAEIWNPNTGTWSVGANAAIYRGYHSQTTLLPNGTILSSGGGTPGPVTNLNAEIYYPPNLFRTVNNVAQLAPRPVISAISGLSYASAAPIQMDMADSTAISQLVLLGASSGTHSFNSGQRRVPLTFSQEGFRLTATLPSANLAPPGYYLLVAVDVNGVPSRGVMIAVGQGVTPPPVTTTPYNPPNLNVSISAPIIAAGSAASYSFTASGNTTYSWSFGDGSPATAFSTNPTVSYIYSQAGVYVVTLTARAADGATSTRTFLQAVAAPATARRPSTSSAMALETRTSASARLWVVNPDNDSVSVIDTASNARAAEIPVGAAPRSLAIAPDGRVWVTNKGSATISIISPSTLAVVQTVSLPRGSQPFGIAFAPGGGSAFVVLEAGGQLLRLDPSTGVQQAAAGIGLNARHLSITADAGNVLVSRFVTPPLPGESTATVDTSAAGAEVLVVSASTMAISRTITLRHSDRTDTEIQGSGVPNYLAAAVISPDGRSAWVPSKQDNVRRGTLRNGQPLDFQNTVRAISSRIDMATLAEDFARRIDHDNSSVGAGADYHPSGVYLFVALETSRQVAVVDAIGGRELMKVDVGRAPQAVTVSADGRRLYVQNFMDRTVSVLDLTPLVTLGELRVPLVATVGSIGTERLAAQVLTGKQLFYDARDPRLARDAYMSCASCHNDGALDGRTWDFTQFGEGLRNTPALAGRGGMAQGFVHWSANFDEIQDFEGQIRAFAGGTGLMTDAQFNTGTRNTPLGDRKTGISADLDALAAYLGSLNTFERSPGRNGDGTLTAAAVAGRTTFANAGCVSCHGGAGFTISADAAAMRNIGTIKATSGRRLGAALTGIDVPTLRDVWKTAPYLHDGSAPTLADALQAHAGSTVAAADLPNLVAYLQQIGSDEPAPGGAPAGTGTGLSASYFGNPDLGGSALVTRTEVPWFDWGTGAPAPGIGADNFSVRWSGELQAVEAGAYQFRTLSDDGVRVWVNGVLLINNWTVHAPTIDTSAAITLAAGQRVPIVVEFQEFGGGAVLQLSWLRPGGAWAAVPAAQLYPAGALSNQAPTVTVGAPASVTLGTAAALTATAADADGSVARVEFYAGASLLGSDTTAPYTFSWTPTVAGTYAVTARAFDNTGAATTSAAVTVTVSAPPNVPPSTAVACASEGGTCVLPAGATASVWYGAGTSWFVRTGVTGSIACTNAVFGDPLRGTVKSCRYQVTSTTPPPNQPPTVTVGAPASVTLGTAAALTATAADADGSVARVEFYAGATLLGSDTTAPYTFSWTPTAAGTYSVTARAFDNVGAATTSAAVAVAVTAGATTLPAGAIAEWTFDTASGTTAPDSSGNGRTLTLGGGVTVTASGRAGAALQFAGPGSGSGATTAAAVVNTAGTFSVSGWIRFDQLPTCWNQIMASQDGVTVSGFYLGIVPPCGGGLPRATFAMLGADLDASATFRITDTATIVTGTWYHLVAVRDATANTMSLYVNGRLAGTLTNTTRWAAGGAFAVGRAKFSGGLRDPAYAAIDGVRAYGRALTAAEVTTLFQAAR